MNKTQRTIKAPVSTSGIGLHTGNQSNLTFKPAAIDSGVTFVRTDLDGRPEIAAHISNVVDILRGTTLAKGEVKVYTVEHVMAALAGLEIDNVIVELDNNEPPVGDGSAMPFIEILQKAEIVDQDAPRKFLEVETPISHSIPDRHVDLVVLPSDDFRVTFLVDYKNAALGTQYTSMVSLKDEFVKDFAPSRTFCFLSEVESLAKLGLIKGGNLTNAVVICDDGVGLEDLKRLRKMLSLKQELFIGKNGLMNDVKLRFPNEPCRHKALDLIGDLALLGVPLKAHVLAARSGHAANVELAKKLHSLYEKEQIKAKYQKEQKTEYLLDIRAIQEILPHRYPFLLIDRVIDLDPKKKVVAIKNVTINEPFFQGHFPGHPVMPGVLIVEAMAQAGGFLMLHAVPDPQKTVAYFLGMDAVRFRKPVVPGDTLRLEVEMLSMRRGTCKISGKTYVGETLVAEAEMMASVVEK
ncbi:MAG TPA: bifunctional UDP-3-O-[3-hydroxymyristoyl] N-acetylglucosamine deacetylase/3-hydroxyacyl-ACP dehydratase [candidate division Zixibacteria bacterium]|nr:bifunctional UDP-3-O-[3-hydroxymyristoyl] N-acetylglucosamine deacetylase/3-hydroxyacyl-ACP dehydratase [candidate division Zixibacteria bacterium]